MRMGWLNACTVCNMNADIPKTANQRQPPMHAGNTYGRGDRQSDVAGGGRGMGCGGRGSGNGHGEGGRGRWGAGEWTGCDLACPLRGCYYRVHDGQGILSVVPAVHSDAPSRLWSAVML